jgi:uncharacterized protein DUF4326
LPPPTPRDFALLIERAGPWVVNVRTPAPFDVYVGRPHWRFHACGWGNEFPMGRRSTREESVGRFWDALEGDEERRARARRELRGKLLACWCFPPLLCHGLVLAWIANDLDVEQRP